MSSGIKRNDLGNRLKALRMSQGLSIREIADAVGVAESTYRDWEYGRKIKGEPYENMAEILGTSLSFLLTGETPDMAADLEKIEAIVTKLKAKL